MTKMGFLLSGVLLLVSCVTKPATDSVSSAQLEERIQVLELKVAETTDRLTGRIHELEEKLAVENAEKEPEKTGMTEQTPVSSTTDSAPSEVSQPATMPPAEKYRQALQLYREKKYTEALKELSTFVIDFPNHKLTPNAHYWIGEVYYDQKMFSKALLAFQRVIDRFPESPKASDALLKAGITCKASGDMPGAVKCFERLKNEYPWSHAASRIPSK
jgi:tol-pal system protein YbgF